MFYKLAQFKQPSRFVDQTALNRAINEEQIEQMKLESVNDSRQILSFV